MDCTECGTPQMMKGVRAVPYTYKGRYTEFLRVEGEFCEECGEMVLSPDSATRLSQEMLTFNKRVNAESVDIGFLRQVRQKFKLGQREAGALFGGGDNAFSRYENGTTEPPVALVKLLKLLDRHPELFDEVKSA